MVPKWLILKIWGVVTIPSPLLVVLQKLATNLLHKFGVYLWLLICSCCQKQMPVENELMIWGTVNKFLDWGTCFIFWFCFFIYTCSAWFFISFMHLIQSCFRQMSRESGLRATTFQVTSSERTSSSSNENKTIFLQLIACSKN